VLGFGNALHGDDGFAAEVCRRLADMALPGVDVIDLGLGALDGLPLLESSRRAILVDAAAPAGQPGRLDVRTAAELLASGLAAPASLHADGLAFLLGAARARGALPDATCVVTAEASGHAPFRPGLSLPVARAVDDALAWIVAHLDSAK
jgi:hydrogenase maturation protease